MDLRGAAAVAALRFVLRQAKLSLHSVVSVIVFRDIRRRDLCLSGLPAALVIRGGASAENTPRKSTAMKATLLILPAAMILALTASLAIGGGKPKTNDVLSMADELKLTAEQKTKIEELSKQRDETLQKYDDAVSKQLAQLSAAKDNAKSIADKSKIENMMKQLENPKERQGIAARFSLAIMGVLTPPQRVQWNAAALATDVEREFNVVTFEDAQKAKIIEFCKPLAAGARSIVDMRTTDNKNTIKPIIPKIYQSVLTPEQQKDYVMAKKEAEKAKSKGGGKHSK